MVDAVQITARLTSLGDAAAARHALRFFKTGPGEYGAGDQFLGIRMPVLRAESKALGVLAPATLAPLLQSPWHEVRMLALVNMVDQARRKICDRAALYQLYMSQLSGVNNWDLVDVSAPDIVGKYLLERDRAPLAPLIKSDNLWHRRIGVLACLTFIRAGETTDIERFALQLLADPEDLMHKAVGWMLREAGKRDEPFLIRFLDQQASSMPRTMLRYAIEKLPEPRRQYYLNK
ncbi:DNA alkylation repair protein [Simiduia agarivorans]|uniref:DNA alkylation repair protein n=1 Tax=Simiduia agarivorans (strain DSM 21679 / JCM 13881 / BCRC 17597 / SA1) TaxID=1117647 RepID=K4KJV7_SIMAS|nr:DNA alkylation repair protein [Simiduia agarivorans]AFU99276.1 hypothetical protein M5M_10475 [Simiduia agarivorans SA1 = DSM 21679]